VPVFTAAVVPIITCTEAAFEPPTETELGNVQVGAGVSGGVTLQVRLTVPLKPKSGVTVRLNVAVCPALIVCELCDPEAVAI
jgi:hypothetical protein